VAQYEVWYYIRNGILYEHYENDGYTSMRKGLESKDVPLCTVEEAITRYPSEYGKALILKGGSNAIR
jgi:hypothetical protein